MGKRNCSGLWDCMCVKCCEKRKHHPNKPPKKPTNCAPSAAPLLIEPFIAPAEGLLAPVETISEPLVGPTGPCGPAGPKGERGDPGECGRNGRDGQNGLNGRDGKDGLQGPAGAPGKDGICKCPEDVCVTDKEMRKPIVIETGPCQKYEHPNDAIESLHCKTLCKHYDIKIPPCSKLHKGLITAGYVASSNVGHGLSQHLEGTGSVTIIGDERPIAGVTLVNGLRRAVAYHEEATHFLGNVEFPYSFECSHCEKDGTSRIVIRQELSEPYHNHINLEKANLVSVCKSGSSDDCPDACKTENQPCVDEILFYNANVNLKNDCDEFLPLDSPLRWKRLKIVDVYTKHASDCDESTFCKSSCCSCTSTSCSCTSTSCTCTSTSCSCTSTSCTCTSTSCSCTSTSCKTSSCTSTSCSCTSTSCSCTSTSCKTSSCTSSSCSCTSTSCTCSCSTKTNNSYCSCLENTITSISSCSSCSTLSSCTCSSSSSSSGCTCSSSVCTCSSSSSTVCTCSSSSSTVCTCSSSSSTVCTCSSSSSTVCTCSSSSSTVCTCSSSSSVCTCSSSSSVCTCSSSTENKVLYTVLIVKDQNHFVDCSPCSSITFLPNVEICDTKYESCSSRINLLAANFFAADVTLVGIHFSTARECDTPTPRINLLVSEGTNVVLRNSVVSDLTYSANASAIVLLPRSSLSQVEAKWNPCRRSPFIGGVVSILGGGHAKVNQDWIPGSALDIKSADGIHLALNVIAIKSLSAIRLSGLARAEIDSILLTNTTAQVISTTSNCQIYCIQDEQQCTE